MGVRAWSIAEEEELIQIYENNKNVHSIASHFGKNHRSVVSKLVSLKIYEKPDKEDKDNTTVKVMLRDLEEMLDIEIDGFNLNKKQNLKKVVNAVKDKLEK